MIRIALVEFRSDDRPEWGPRMHGINLDALNEAELIELHDAVVDLHVLHQQKTTHALLELAIGERLMFEDNNGQTQAGIVIRRNRKTVTVHGDNGRQWNVSPQLLRKEKRAGAAQGGNLVPFSRKG
nr:hypothetical protein [Sinorhizobium meliloti]